MKLARNILLLAGVLLCWPGCDPIARRGVSPEHAFLLTASPAFLTEELALARARDTLVLDGFNTNSWQAVKDSPSAAPDGRRDEYLVRNTVAVNRGVIAFTNAASTRFVSVTLAGAKVICQGSRSK